MRCPNTGLRSMGLYGPAIPTLDIFMICSPSGRWRSSSRSMVNCGKRLSVIVTPQDLCRKHFQNVAVRVTKVKPAATMTVIDLHVVQRPRSAAESNALGAHPLENFVKLRLANLEGIVVALELRIMSKSRVSVSLICSGAKWDTAPS